MSDGISWNFTDAQGRCCIAGTEVSREVYDEFEAAWERVATLEDGIRSALGSMTCLRAGCEVNHGMSKAATRALRALLDASHDQEQTDE